MDKNSELGINPEVKIDPHVLAVATITFYPGWYPGEVTQTGDLTSKVRGDIGLKTLREAKEKGYRVVVVDGGSSDEFKSELTNIEITSQPQLEKGYSGARQQSYIEASKLNGVKVILSTEAEKLSAIHDCLTDAIIQPVLRGETDIIIFKREGGAFSTYPKDQAEYEQKANKLWNDIMKKHNLLPPSAEDLDVWFGPRLIKNDPRIVSLFLDQYKFDRGSSKLDQIVDPFVYANSLFFPITIALRDELRVSSMVVPYRHPPSQTQMENEDMKFRRKRDIQYKNIIVSTLHLIRMLENNPKGRLKRI